MRLPRSLVLLTLVLGSSVLLLVPQASADTYLPPAGDTCVFGYEPTAYANVCYAAGVGSVPPVGVGTFTPPCVVGSFPCSTPLPFPTVGPVVPPPANVWYCQNVIGWNPADLGLPPAARGPRICGDDTVLIWL